MNPLQNISTRKGLLALSPLFLMVLLFVVLSAWLNDFYKVPLLILFIMASAYGICLLKGKALNERIALFSRCAANSNLLLMVWIFILAGAFASSAKTMGAVDATVNATLMLVPSSMLLAGLFLAACFVSLSIGTSVGTIVALVPVAVGISQQTAMALPLVVAATVGGAFFGDNLSFISDTTVVATRSQGCRMREKFLTNIYIALPAALLTMVLYAVLGMGEAPAVEVGGVELIKIIPYLFILVAAVCGVNVLVVLFVGILLTGVIGVYCGAYDLGGWFGCISEGIQGMSELIIISMLAGGLLGIVKELGGIDWLLQMLIKRVKSHRGAEYCIALLVSVTNVCTANNTIAILTVGNLVKDISTRFGVHPRKAASVLDTFSCCVQGVLPYGIQLLMAGGLASLSPVEIIPYLYYPFFLLAVSLLAIQFNFPKIKG